MKAMKKMMVMAALVCFAALNVNAQTEETESKGQKFFRLTKEADDNPTDWKAQLEAGHFLLDKENGIYNQSQAAKYYERIFHLATDYNKEIPDSIIRETGITLMTLASEKKDIDRALLYIDEMIHADKNGVDVGVDFLNSVSVMGLLYRMSKEDYVTSLKYILDFRERITKNNLSGIEHTDVTTAILFEHLLAKYKEMLGDKLIETELDGKKYILISKGDWNIEKPLMGWMDGEEKAPTLLYGEDGKIYDNLHGQMEYSFAYGKTGVVAKEGTNMWMITVTPERRQQMVEAYRDYMKKSKK